MKYLTNLVLICGLVTISLAKKHHHHSNKIDTDDTPFPIIPRKYNGTQVMNETDPTAWGQFESVLKFDLDGKRLFVQDPIYLWGHTSIRGKGMFLQGNGCVKSDDFPIDPSEIPNYTDYPTYKGISVDPLVLTDEKYHVREKMTYN